jgi:hypothetical protein
MRKCKLWLLAAVFLVATNAIASQLTIEAPETLEVKEPTLILVRGLTQDQVPELKASVEPSENVMLFGPGVWADKIGFFFWARSSGKYTVTASLGGSIDLSEWKQSIFKEIDGADGWLRVMGDTIARGRDLGVDRSAIESLESGLQVRREVSMNMKTTVNDLPIGEAVSCMIEVGDPTPPPDNPYPVPSASDQAKVRDITLVRLSRDDSEKLADLYGRASDVIFAYLSGKQNEVTTPGDMRTWLIENGKKLGMQGRYEGLPEAVNKASDALFGRAATRKFTASDRFGFQTLAWAVWEAGHRASKTTKMLPTFRLDCPPSRTGRVRVSVPS